MSLNCSSADSELACVQDADPQTIRDIVNEGNLDFSPVNDNVTQAATPYLEARAGGNAAKVPFFTGTTAQEGTILSLVYNLDILDFSQEQLEQYLALLTGGDAQLISQFQGLIQAIQQTDGLSLFYAAAQAYTELVYQCVSEVYRE